MATARKSTKGRVCATCHKPKKALDFPTTSAENCLQCLADAAVAPPPVEDASVPPDEAPFIVNDSEIDYESPSAQELAARTLARRRLLPFIKRFRPKYMAGWVHEDICRRLERFLLAVERQESPRMLLCMPVRMGKQLAHSTPMLTTKGWSTHGELTPGDFVFGPDGKPTEVVAVSGETTSDVLVTMSNGGKILCHENHEWTVYQRSRSRWITVPTKFWLDTGRFGKIRQLKSGPRYIYQLPLVKPVEFENADYTMHPYVLGAWLGDGSAGKPCITGAAKDSEITKAIADLGYPITAVCEHNTTKCLTTYYSGNNTDDVGLVPRRNGRIPGRMSQELMALGIFQNKRIPESYQRLSAKLRLELLAGLIDTDGSVDKAGRVHISTVSDVLRDDIIELVRSLGMWAGCYTAPPVTSTSGIVGRRPTHYVGFTPTMFIPTRLPRKFILGKPAEAISIVSVQRVLSTEQGRCIQVNRSDGMYLAGSHLTPTHNSEIGSRHFAPFVLGHHPEWEVIAASGGQTLALTFSRYIRDLMRDPAYQSLFPETRLDPSSQSVENWNTTSGGGYMAAGIGTMIVGRGANVLLIDDPCTSAEAADSQVQRDAVWEWYIANALNRLAPGGGVLGIMTHWNEDDWAGRVQQLSKLDDGGDKFEIVKYPAINDQGDEYILADDSIEQFPPGSTIPAGARMTRPQNTPLHADRYTLKMLLNTRATYFGLGQQRWWHALYQQSPTVDDGVFFTSKMFRHYVTDPHPLERSSYQTWDFAITEGQQNDYTVGATGHVDERNNLHIADIVRFKSDDSFVIADAILDNWVEHGSCAQIGFEDGVIWKSISAVFLRRCEERGLFPSYEMLVPLSDKAARAQPLRGLMQGGKVWFKDKASWWEACRKELTQFLSGGKHDDIVDSLAWLARLALKHSAPRAPEPKKMKSWKDGLLARLNGGATTHMSA